MKRRSFFQLILACLGLSKLKAKPTVHTSGYLQLAGRDYVDEFASSAVPAFSNRFLSRYEGRTIPSNVVFGQVCGGINKSPFHAQQTLATQKLKSTTKE